MTSPIARVFAILSAVISFSFGQDVQCGISNSNGAGSPEFPWQVSLQLLTDGWRHRCSGTIIDKNWIVTAAQCVDALLAKEDLRVVIGVNDVSNPAATSVQELVRTRDVTIHPLWNRELIDYDFALVQLPKPLDFTGAHKNLRPICMPKANQTFEGMKCDLTGWGLTLKTNSTNQSGVVEKLKADVTSFSKCSEAWTQSSVGIERRPLTDRQLCAISRLDDTKSTKCNDDAIGLLQCRIDNRLVLAGVTSFTLNCSSDEYPSVYARISQVLGWVNRVKQIKTRE